MTSKQIRSMPLLDYKATIALMLQEIAAQLAEMNEGFNDGARAISVAVCASNDVIPVRVHHD